MRPSMKLDLAASPLADHASTAVLSSPDVRQLTLASPELEKLVLLQYRPVILLYTLRVRRKQDTVVLYATSPNVYRFSVCW